jgi:hypothetical protein
MHLKRAELLREVPTSGLMARVPTTIHAEIRRRLLAERMTICDWVIEAFEVWEIWKNQQRPTEPSDAGST